MLLDPNSRSLLTDALMPPPGMHFDAGLATTYSLDPTALLTVPVHLAWLASGRDRDLFTDPLRMLEALRRVASRFTIFCQRGRMLAPDHRPSPLYGLLEPMLRESVAPHGGSFHAKVWLLRYLPDDADTSPAVRLIVQSRNLTFDRSWDASLKLDGRPNGERTRQRNMPLGRFLDALLTSRVCSKALSSDRRTVLESLIRDARQTDWEYPSGFTDLKFHALGLDDRAWLPDESKELAVISPFVRAGALQRLLDTTENARLLVARPDELDAIPAEVVQQFGAVKVLSEQAASGDAEDAPPNADSGLHAKLYVLQTGWGGSDTHVIVGSANATDRVMVRGVAERSLELLIELAGKRRDIGRIDDLLDADGLGGLLADYNPASGPLLDVDQLAIERQKLLERIRERIAGVDWSISCVSADGGWTLALSAPPALDFEDVEVRAWPLTVDSLRAVLVHGDDTEPTPLGAFATEEVTSLLGFRIRATDREMSFAIEARVEGLPPERDAAIDRRIISDPDKFVQYVLMLLGSLVPPGSEGGSGSWAWAGSGSSGWQGPALFDLLAKAYARDPKQIEPVARLVHRLSADGAGAVVPDEFQEIWRVFVEALKKDGIDVDAI